MANAFDDDERETWLRKAVDAVRSTSHPDRVWPAGTHGAWAVQGQRMFPASPRGPEQPGAFTAAAIKAAPDARAIEDAIRRAACRRALRSVLSVLADRIAVDEDWWIDVAPDGTAHVGVDEVIVRISDHEDDWDAPAPIWSNLHFTRGATKAEIRDAVEAWFADEAG